MMDGRMDGWMQKGDGKQCCRHCRQVTTRGHQKEMKQEAVNNYLVIVNQAGRQPRCTCRAPHTTAARQQTRQRYRSAEELSVLNLSKVSEQLY